MIRVFQRLVSFFRGRRSGSRNGNGNGTSPPQPQPPKGSDKDDYDDVLKTIASLGGPKRAPDARSSKGRRIYDRK